MLPPCRPGGGKATRLTFPRIQGTDTVGTIVAVGEGVSPDRIGERVMVDFSIYNRDDDSLADIDYMGHGRDGGYAEYQTVPAENAHVVDTDMSDVELATFCCAYLTGEQMLERAALKAGERVLVTGASGGVGSGIVQLARARGAIPYAVVGKGKEQAVLDIGAEAVITRGVADLPQAVDEATGGQPIDVVADLVGGAIFNDLLRILGPRAATPRPARSPDRSCSSISGPCISSSCSCMARARARARISAASSATSRRRRSGRWSAASTGSPISTARRPTSSPRILSASWLWCPTPSRSDRHSFRNPGIRLAPLPQWEWLAVQPASRHKQ